MPFLMGNHKERPYQYQIKFVCKEDFLKIILTFTVYS